MKNLTFILLSVSCLLFAGCSQNDILESDYVIRYGTSFGECMGDCYRETSITKYQATLRVQEYQQGKQTELEVRAEKGLTVQDFEQINSLVDTDIIQALPEAIGCPDCADGGAEWIEIQSPGLHKKVTFEYLNEPNSVKDLVTKLRELQNNLYIQD
ncbi:hypothetical protein [Gracilimonas sp.]|uniref:hypothetical protein n=1 Tax=Gracilimonas sp. TaxID=1974203 RepID=UPI0032EF1AE9